MEIPAPYLIYLGDVHDQLAAKTGQGVVDWRPEKCIGQLRLDGCKADLGITDLSIAEAASQGAKTLLIGVVNSGGFLPDHWQDKVVEAIAAGMHIASGLHIRLSDLPKVKAAAEQHCVQLFDVRHPGRPFKTGTGVKRSGKRLLMVGTDCSCGKKYSALALDQAMRARGMNSTFRATGQTGVLIAGGGVAIDAVVADFISGAAEWLSPDNEADHWDVIEGQGSLFHPAFAGVSMGLLHGSQPDALVLCHEPTRTHMRNVPHQPLPDVEVCLNQTLAAAQLTNPAVRFAGLCVNTSKLNAEEKAACLRELQSRTGLPAVDPLVDDVSPILANLP